MTLKIRNRILQLFLYISLAVLAVSLAVFIIAAARKTLVVPPSLRIPAFLSNIPFLKQDFFPTMLSFAFIGIYIPAVFFYLIKYFENTQSSEIIFFSAFLIALLCESARFFIICFNVWQTFTNLLIFLGNIILFGRILAPLSFVCSSLLSENEQRQDIERNCLLMVMAAFVFSLIIPLNTAKISSSGLVEESSMFLLNGTRVIFVVLSALSFYIKSAKHANKDYISAGNWMMVLFLGYVLLISADNYVFMVLGTAFLYAGTFFYLKTLHKIYMWI